MKNGMPVVVSLGVGVNSIALLEGLKERDERPDAILFANTKGERSHTYRTLEDVRDWCRRSDFPDVTTVFYDSPRHASLEDECFNNKTLPSLAFGNKGCSVKWKRQPMDAWIREWQPALDAWSAGLFVVRYMGIHWGEQHRGQVPNDDQFLYDRPLIRWKWGQQECEAACIRAIGYVPKKSFCWFCPANKKREVIALAKEEPLLFRRGVEMEHNAKENLGATRGLGRHWTWEEVVAADERQLKMFPESEDVSCICE